MCGISRDRVAIPGYEGYYWIDRDGNVCNADGHTIKPSRNRAGELVVELRKFGQREKILVLDLLRKVGYNTLGGVSNENG